MYFLKFNFKNPPMFTHLIMRFLLQFQAINLFNGKAINDNSSAGAIMRDW